MSQTNVSIRMDSELKKQFNAFCNDMGMTMTTAFNLFARKTVREYRIPFEIGVDPFYSESNIRYLEQKMEDYKAGKIAFEEHELFEDED